MTPWNILWKTKLQKWRTSKWLQVWGTRDEVVTLKEQKLHCGDSTVLYRDRGDGYVILYIQVVKGHRIIHEDI